MAWFKKEPAPATGSPAPEPKARPDEDFALARVLDTLAAVMREYGRVGVRPRRGQRRRAAERL